MAYSIQEGFERDTSDDWDRFLYNGIIDYGFTHEAFIPGLTSYRVSQGQSPKQYIGSIGLPMATAYAITAWATGQAHVSLASASFTALTGVTPGAFAMNTAVVAAPVVATVAGTKAFVEFHKKYEPKEPTHQPSWWNSLAAAMGGTFGGMEY